MKMTIILGLGLLLAAALNLTAQEPPGNHGPSGGDLAFYHPLTLASVKGGGTGGAEPAANEADSQEALAKAAQNPIAAMISVPFQNNFNFGIGPNNVMQYNLNVQPVIPISLSEDWNLITRTVIPTINQPSPAPGVRSAFGLGDINPQFYFSPAKPDKLIWGVGPTFTFPTATDPMLGQRQVQRRPGGRGAHDPGPLGRGRGGQPAMVLRWLGRQ